MLARARFAINLPMRRNYSVAHSTGNNFKSYRKRRSLFNVPGSDERKLQKIEKLFGKVDTVVLDLEDGVALSKKADARRMVASKLKAFGLGTPFERAVRINTVGSGLGSEDLEAIAGLQELETIVIPKVDSADDVEEVEDLVKRVRDPSFKPLQYLACIESAKSLQRVDSIAQSSNYLCGLVFASEDYCADTGISRTESLLEMLYARSAVVNAAKAYDLQAIDLVCIDFKNSERLRWECENGRNMGFTGKQAIHPDQLEIIQEMFQPTEKQIDFAKRIIEGARKHNIDGVGAFDLDGKVIDLPMVKQAMKVLMNAGVKVEVN